MHLSRVFQFAVASGRAERDPSRDLGGALAPTKEKHLASITDPQEVGALLRAIDADEGAWITPYPSRLAPLVFVRPGELRAVGRVRFRKAEWRIPATRILSGVPYSLSFATARA